MCQRHQVSIWQRTVPHPVFRCVSQDLVSTATNKTMRRLAPQYLDEMGVNIPSVDADVAALSGGQRQAIAVARSVYSNARLLLLDEPLAAMGAKEGGQILRLIESLKRRGDI